MRKINDFRGRSEELSRLLSDFKNERAEVILLYGRRRIGKSALIKQALALAEEQQGTRTLYYECKQTSEDGNLRSISVQISELFQMPLSFPDAEELLDFLFRKAEEEKLIFVLDEYTYLREVSPGLDSVVQAVVDKYRERKNCKMKLVLCGSYIDTMQSLVWEQNPLYGRVDLTMQLQAMDYFESALFYPDFSDEDKVRLYSIFGGVPHYNRLIDPEKSVRENAAELLVTPGARLEGEVPMLLHSEIAKIVNANEVLETLGRGFSKYSDILSQSHVSGSSAMADILARLIRMELVEKRAPINDEGNKRKAGYFISDGLTRFYYRYLFRYNSQRNVMNPDQFWDRYIETDFEEHFVPLAFEGICKQYLIRENRSGKMAEPFEKIGKYYYDDPKRKKNGEFDLVTLDAKGYIFYEVKFRKTPLSRSMAEEEMAQVRDAGLNCYRFGFFARAGFETGLPKGIIRIPLKELYR